MDTTEVHSQFMEACAAIGVHPITVTPELLHRTARTLTGSTREFPQTMRGVPALGKSPEFVSDAIRRVGDLLPLMSSWQQHQRTITITEATSGNINRCCDKHLRDNNPQPRALVASLKRIVSIYQDDPTTIPDSINKVLRFAQRLADICQTNDAKGLEAELAVIRADYYRGQLLDVTHSAVAYKKVELPANWDQGIRDEGLLRRIQPYADGALNSARARPASVGLTSLGNL